MTGSTVRLRWSAACLGVGVLLTALMTSSGVAMGSIDVLNLPVLETGGFTLCCAGANGDPHIWERYKCRPGSNLEWWCEGAFVSSGWTDCWPSCASSGVQEIVCQRQRPGTQPYIALFEVDREKVLPGIQRTGACEHPSITADGRYFAYDCNSTGTSHIYVYDRGSDWWVKGTGVGTHYGPHGPIGNAAQGADVNPFMSADGRYVVFESNRAQPGATWDVYVHDRSDTTNDPSVLDTPNLNFPVSQKAFMHPLPTITPDGRYLAFVAKPNGATRSIIYVYDRVTHVRQEMVPGWPTDMSYPCFTLGGKYLLFAGFAKGSKWNRWRVFRCACANPMNVQTSSLCVASNTSLASELSSVNAPFWDQVQPAQR